MMDGIKYILCYIFTPQSLCQMRTPMQFRGPFCVMKKVSCILNRICNIFLVSNSPHIAHTHIHPHAHTNIHPTLTHTHTNQSKLLYDLMGIKWQKCPAAFIIQFWHFNTRLSHMARLRQPLFGRAINNCMVLYTALKNFHTCNYLFLSKINRPFAHIHR